MLPHENFDALQLPRPPLPERDVSADTIEEAYVRFIFHCNPGVPPDSDTKALREAFRNPPRSGGKTFHPFAIFELVRRFYEKEVKTWTELTTLLGVEPPDSSKDESSQKIAQYGVRLKKWMNLMHVKAFFEYLMQVPNEYWTRIPFDPSPIAWAMRDGVALEDDMALRALLPYIRPRRARKRPVSDDAGGHRSLPPSKRHVSSPGKYQQHGGGGGDGDGGGSPQATPAAYRPRTGSSWSPGGESNAQPQQDGRWSTSAAISTPSRSNLWDKAAEAPSQAKPPAHRRGAKNVSSAWRSSGSEAGGRPRGRPPMHRHAVDSAGAAAPSWTTGRDSVASRPGFAGPAQPAANRLRLHDYVAEPGHPHVTARSSSPSAFPHQFLHNGHTARTPPRDRANAFSHDREQRWGSTLPGESPERTFRDGENGDLGSYASTQAQKRSSGCWQTDAKQAADLPAHGSGLHDDDEDDCSVDPALYDDEPLRDWTHDRGAIRCFTQRIREAEWLDSQGQPDERASLEEARALTEAILHNIHLTSSSPQDFLVNLGTLGGSLALGPDAPRVTRVSQTGEVTVYRCEWARRFGPIAGSFALSQPVPHSLWKKQATDGALAGAEAGMKSEAAEGSGPSTTTTTTTTMTTTTTEHWRRQNELLHGELDRRKRQLSDLRRDVMRALLRPLGTL